MRCALSGPLDSNSPGPIVAAAPAPLARQGISYALAWERDWPGFAIWRWPDIGSAGMMYGAGVEGDRFGRGK